MRTGRATSTVTKRDNARLPLPLVESRAGGTSTPEYSGHTRLKTSKCRPLCKNICRNLKKKHRKLLMHLQGGKKNNCSFIHSFIVCLILTHSQFLPALSWVSSAELCRSCTSSAVLAEPLEQCSAAGRSGLGMGNTHMAARNLSSREWDEVEGEKASK